VTGMIGPSAEGTAIPLGRSQPRRRRSVRWSGVVGLAIVMLAVLVAVLAPWLAPHAPGEVDITARLKPPVWLEGGSTAHWLGTDQLGRDLLSRIVYGTRSSLLVAGLAVLITTVVGGLAGIIAAYFGGWPDQVVSRLVDIQLAFPSLLLAITIMAVTTPSLAAVVAVLAISSWVVPCRIVRSRALAVGAQDFIVGAVATGARHPRIVLRHVLPNVLPTLVTIGTLQAAHFVLAEASLSFLGLGLPPAIPSWGGIMNQGRDYIELAWWIETFPGLAIVLLISGFGLLGDWVRDALDPRMRE
jgi:peptide/nickel transport system permease protein